MADQPENEHFHQIEQRTGRIDRVPEGRRPLVEMRLWPNQRLVSLRLTELPQHRNRKTVDWVWTAVIDTDCGEIPTPEPRWARNAAGEEVEP